MYTDMEIALNLEEQVIRISSAKTRYDAYLHSSKTIKKQSVHIKIATFPPERHFFTSNSE